ncbi:IS66 family transposase zinc-finger binding domain-containing protein [Treponema sp.]|uniref:IS66 family transposase zinc-finger binding domain-containing protein n=1 Tax=Treponema sp. TaxID=166 RepID=UPI003FD7CC5C
MKIGEDTSEQLIHIPEQIYVLQTIRPKYACRNCEGSGDEDKAAVRQMPAPKRIIEKSIASPTLLASVISNKFELALPY